MRATDERPKPGGIRRRIRMLTAGALVAGVIGAAGVVAVPTATPAVAAEPVSAVGGGSGAGDSWVKTLNSLFGDVTKMFGVDKMPEVVAVNFALTWAGPLISALFGISDPKQPSIQDVLDELKTVETQLSNIETDLSRLETEINQVNANVLMSTCKVETSELTPFFTQLQQSQRGYGDLLAAASPDKDGKVDPTRLGIALNAFIKVTVGDDGGQARNSTMATRISDVHNALVSTGGTQGILQTCGEAYFQQWMLDTAPGAAADVSGRWVDDQQYYGRLMDVLRFWQTAQAQGAFLLQQAVLMQAALQFVAGGPLTLDDAASVCYVAKQGTTVQARTAATTCDYGLEYNQELHADFVQEWQQAGIPYSDDKVVMSLGTSVTGLKDGTTEIPTRVWARKPSFDFALWATGTLARWDNTNAPVVARDGLSFTPSGSADWNGLIGGYRASHPAVTPPERAVLQQPSSRNDPWTIGGTVAKFAPLDILATMRSTRTTADQPTAFNADLVSQVWLPGETATRHKQDYWYSVRVGSHRGASSAFLPTAALDWQDDLSEAPWKLTWVSIETNPYYYGGEPEIRCSVMNADGIVCGSTIDSWWTARQHTDVTPTSGSNITMNYSIEGTYALRPTDPTIGDFTVSGYNLGCTGTECGIDGNRSVTAPAWINEAHPYVSGQTFGGGPLTSQTLWPVAKIATLADCGGTDTTRPYTNVWGTPSRCGDAFTAWAAQNVPDPAFGGLVAKAAPTVRIGAGAMATCIAPSWDGSPAGVVYDDTTWTITDTKGHSTVQSLRHGATADLAALMKNAGWTTIPAAYDVTCLESAGVSGHANRTAVASDAVRVTTAGEGGDTTPAPTTPATAPAEQALTPDAKGGVQAPAMAAAGQEIRVYVGTEHAGEWVSVWMFSTPTQVGGWMQVAADGYVTVTVPAGLAAGTHRIAVLDADGNVLGWQEIAVTAPAAASASRAGALAATGTDAAPLSAYAAGAVLLLALGAGVVVLARRRRAAR
jgi:hypothetical protein